MLRVSFPVAILADSATFDIQYGYAKRPTHRNTSWDQARFEVVGHRYADLSEPDYGVALLNDCKYGYKVHRSVLDLCLLRSPTYPDPDADRGHHEFTYSFLPHTGDLIRSNVIAEAALLNQPPIRFDGCHGDAAQMPIRLDGDGVSLEVVKRAEKEECLVLRIIETHGCRSAAVLYVDPPWRQLISTNLIEWTDGPARDIAGPVALTLDPFEIRTYKLKM
jgi:alpha-mannosidase